MSAAAAATTLRAVIVDDTEDLRALLRMALVRGGMSVVGEAGDGRAGIEAVRVGQPDVVLLDLSMPVMDGLEALPHIRALAPTARIIVLSGFGATQMSERAMALGADGYLQKGASLGRILDHIRDLVAGRDVDPVGRPPDPVQDGLASGTALAGRTTTALRTAGSDAWDVLALAPFGVIEVGLEAPYRVRRANRPALDLLASPTTPDTPLHDVAPAVAATVVENRLRGDLEFESAVAGVPVQVTLRHTSASLLLYLRPIADEVSLLRSAIATTAHEIRGPVSVLTAVAETLTEAEDGEVDAAQHERLLASISRQSKMLDSITADLLTAAQIHRGTLRVDARPVDPRMVAEAVVQDRHSETVAIEVEDHRHVVADPLRLEQMLGNLVTNAHKYGAPPVLVRIRPSREHAGVVCIDVQDSGEGVPVDFRMHLFREFSRAAGTSAVGTGLGLHVVRTLAEAQGGSITYAPAITGGAMFTLCLPAAVR